MSKRTPSRIARPTSCHQHDARPNPCECEGTGTETLLNQSKTKLRTLLDSSAAGVAQAHLDGRFIGANHKYLQMLGYSEEELRSLTIMDVTHPEDRVANRKLFQKVLDHKIPEFTFEKRYLHKKGHSIWVEIGVSAIYDEHCHPCYWLAVALDITKRKEAEAALRESEEEYRTLFHSLEEGFCVLEMIYDDQDHPIDYRFVNTNRAFEKQTGLKNASGKTARELIPALNQSWFDLYGGIARSGTPARFENFASVMNRWFSVYAFPFGKPENQRVGLLFSDITARKNRELTTAFLSEITSHFARLSKSEHILKLTAKHIIRHLNVSCVSILSFDEKEDGTTVHHECQFKQPPERECPSPADGLTAPLRKQLRSGHTVAINGAARRTPTPGESGHGRDETVFAQLHAPYVSDDSWKFLITLRHHECHVWSKSEIELMTDLAARLWLRLERAQTEEALRQSEQRYRDLNRSLEERVEKRTAELREQTRRLRDLAAELASAEQRERKRLAALLHDDLQQLLVAANMQIGILTRHVDGEKGRNYIDQARRWIHEAIGAARDLTRELRPPALYEDGLVAALYWLSSEMSKKHHLKVTVEAVEIRPHLSDDVRALLFDCIRELLFNVTKYAEVDHASVRVWEQGDVLRIIVADDGRGFKVTEMARNRRSGGFGLFSIRERLAPLGGDMTIESAHGLGTRVEIKTPLTKAALPSPPLPLFFSPKPQTRQRPAVTPEHRRRILVVDDHAMVREGIATVLNSDERLLVVGQASDGVEAIEAVEQHQPDAMLIDVNMPRMNGIEATRQILHRWPGLVVIGLSVQDDEATAKSMTDAGAAAFLPKAGNSDEMIRTLMNLALISPQKDSA